MADNLIVANASTYRDFTDSEIEIYRDALAMPQMMEVYELMNAIHFTIMADRFERHGTRNGELDPNARAVKRLDFKAKHMNTCAVWLTLGSILV